MNSSCQTILLKKLSYWNVICLWLLWEIKVSACPSLYARIISPLVNLTGLHFNLPGHSFHHLEGLAVEQVRSRDPFILKARESWIIQKLDCFRNGQNKEPWNTTSLASVGFLIFLSSSFTSWRSASFWYFGYLYMSTFSFILLLWTWSLRGRNILAISILFVTLKQEFCLSFEPIL